MRGRHVGAVAAALRPRVSGGCVVAAERDLLLSDSDDLEAPLRVFDYDPAGGLTGGRPFGVVDPGHCAADGLTVDAGGEGLGPLFVTASALGVDRAEQPAAGALFAADPGVRGRHVLPTTL
ncbi:hypothetical protein [Nonomuraea jiangxiensis]|uniref:Uncharacterized protein n=1 Tax=Nonomuraea jiangxiensis TaxID=633440 RepID=A0A1G9AMZ9_9ACTN|nr:hypothetical protein [Nonomuraea jiangxiensis]SDK28688.1 hypothetical protein SAMN05421869_1152 [Nonomuraea jiangxiensis]